MRFLRLAAASALVLTLAASSASAQSRFVIGGGSTLGLSNVAETENGGFSNGPSLLVGYEYVAKSGFGVRIDGMYHRISGDDQPATVGGALLSSRLDVINGTANLLYVFKTAGSFKPYLIGGIGYYSYKAAGEVTEGATVESINDFGFNAGAGFEGGSGKVKYFGEARFHQIQSKDDAVTGSFNPRVLPITVGVKLPFGAK